MKMTKLMFAAGLVSAVGCCFADLPWMMTKPAPVAAKVEVQHFDGVQIERLGGQVFEKKDVNGMTSYQTELSNSAGLKASVSVIMDAKYGNALPSMAEYAKMTQDGFKSMGCNSPMIKEQDDDSMVVSAVNDQTTFFVKVIRDVGKSRFVVATGTVVVQGGVTDAVKDITSKIERCVSSIRKEEGGTGTGTATLPVQPTSNVADASLQSVDGILVERLDGHAFEKKDVDGDTVYVAELPTTTGLKVNVTIVTDTEKGDTLSSLSEFVQGFKEEMKSQGFDEFTVREQGDDNMLVRMTNEKNQTACFVKLLRDVKNRRFVAVIGSVVVQGNGMDADGKPTNTLAAEGKNIGEKVKRCVRSARTVDGGTGTGIGTVTPPTQPTSCGTDASLQEVNGVLVERLDGHDFVEETENGTKTHMAELPAPPGLRVFAFINMADAQSSGTALPSMAEYAQQSKSEMESMGFKNFTVKEQDDDSMIITASNDQAAFFVKVLRDVKNSRFVIVTGGILDQGGGANAKEDELKGFVPKIQKCVRSARLK